jgi:large repetitive protein
MSDATTCGLTGTHDTPNADPELGSLAENGGPTETLMPGPSSPAGDVVPSGTMANGLTVCGSGSGGDQRGINRPFGFADCTIGAVEDVGGVAPSITNGPSFVFSVGQAQTVSVDGNGFPAPVFSEVGALPDGLSFSRDGELTGTPAPGSGGVYPITVTATNGISPDATASFEVNVSDGPPVFTSSATPTFLDGMPNTFVVSASGAPVPAVHVSLKAGKLPSWLGVTNNGTQNVTISGTPPVGTKKIYVFGVSAMNFGGTTPQTLTLTVGYPPSLLGPSGITDKVGMNRTFTLRTRGFPVPVITQSGTLPTGVTFTPLGNGTARLTGIPAAGTGGVYPIGIGGANSAGAASEIFTLTVDESPTISSATSVTFTHGQFNTFTVTTGHAYPAVTGITQGGRVPTGVSFVYTGGGEGVLSGTQGAAQTVPDRVTFTATNGVAYGKQTFTLNVN